MGRIKKRKKIAIIAIAAVILCTALAVGGVMIYGRYQASMIPGMTFTEALAYTTNDVPDAVITVGIIQDGQISYNVYGENGTELPAELHTYEIGSLTKTFTAALIHRAIGEGRIGIDSTIDSYLSLPDGNEYPTIKELLTHTPRCAGICIRWTKNWLLC